MKPNVLLIVLPYVVKNIDSNRPKIRSFLAFPYGLLSVATYCKDLATIKIVDLNVYDLTSDAYYAGSLQVLLEDFRPDIVGFSMMFDNSYADLEELCGFVKDFDPHILTVLGGSAASYSYEEILSEQEDIDAICIGEGELPFSKLLQEWVVPWDFEYIWRVHPSLITDRSAKYGLVRLGPDRESAVQNLDEVIDIDYSFVNVDDYDMQEAFSPFVSHKKQKQYFISTTRGCPFSCTFCSNAAIHGKEVRFASVSRIIEHVRYLRDNYGLEVLTIYDDQMLIDPPRAKQIFFELAQFGIRVEAPNGFSVRYIDAEMASLMRSAGMDTIYLAIESGCEYVLKNLIKKPLKLSQVAPAIEHLRHNDFFIHAFFVMGMPGETPAMREETRQFILDSDLDWAGLNMATPVRGSQLYKDCIKNGWIQKQRIGEIEDKKYIIRIPGIDHEEVEQQVYDINIDVNFAHNRRMRVGDYEVAANCFREVIRRYSGHEWAKNYLEICEGKLNERNRTVHSRQGQTGKENQKGIRR